jgi:hypothetical protein
VDIEAFIVERGEFIECCREPWSSACPPNATYFPKIVCSSVSFVTKTFGFLFSF